MAAPEMTIRRPIPVDELPPPEIPAHLLPAPPSALRVTQIVRELAEGPRIAVVFKRTYDLGQAGCSPADEQPPLDEEGGLHDPLAPEVAPSLRSLPETVAYKTGTDLVIQGSAQPPAPTPECMVGVQVGAHRHEALVIGDRRCDYAGGRLVFTPPAPFDEMPLRYELAYGGTDPAYLRTLVDEVERSADPDALRRVRPVLGPLLSRRHPLHYPRNRLGRGYVLDAQPQAVVGRELPNLERPDDRLTPERLLVPHFLDWVRQPLPVGFDFLDPLAFPRSAMLGIAQATRGREALPEVERGLVPADFQRGRLFQPSAEGMPPDCIHPLASRCASLGLWLPFLAGGETLVLRGMRADAPEWRVRLPGERPAFSLPRAFAGESLPGELLLVALDLAARKLRLVWAASAPLSQALQPGQAREVEASVALRMVEV